MRRIFLLGATSVVLGVLLQIPQILHNSHPDSKGIEVLLSSDESMYLSRVTESLEGRPEQSNEAFTGDTKILGTQGALLEQTIGTVFRPLGLRAPEVMRILKSVFAVLLFLGIVVFFLESGFSFILAYSGAVLFCLLLLNALGRPVQPAGSETILVWMFVCIQYALRGKKRCGILAGIFLGSLVGVYFWAWTFAWAWVALLFCLEAIHMKRGDAFAWKRMQTLLWIVAIGVLCALPFLMQTWDVLHHPLAEFGKVRSGMRLSHLPESFVYSGLFLAMGGGILFSYVRHPDAMYRYKYAVLTLLTALAVIHQQMLHGVILDFVSHYLFSLVLAAICALLIFFALRFKALAVTALAAAVYLAAIGWDGRTFAGQFTVHPEQFSEQHFSTLLPVLDAMPRKRILSDPQTMEFISMRTKHDIVFSVYLQHTLVTDEELAERYCLSIIGFPREQWVTPSAMLISPAAARAVPARRIEEEQLIRRTCEFVAKNLPSYIEKYGIDAVAINEDANPVWDISRFRLPLEKVATGSGWTLWGL